MEDFSFLVLTFSLRALTKDFRRAVTAGRKRKFFNARFSDLGFLGAAIVGGLKIAIFTTSRKCKAGKRRVVGRLRNPI